MGQPYARPTTRGNIVPMGHRKRTTKSRHGQQAAANWRVPRPRDVAEPNPSPDGSDSSFPDHDAARETEVRLLRATLRYTRVVALVATIGLMFPWFLSASDSIARVQSMRVGNSVVYDRNDMVDLLNGLNQIVAEGLMSRSTSSPSADGRLTLRNEGSLRAKRRGSDMPKSPPIGPPGNSSANSIPNASDNSIIVINMRNAASAESGVGTIQPLYWRGELNGGVGTKLNGGGGTQLSGGGGTRLSGGGGAKLSGGGSERNGGSGAVQRE